MKDFPFSIYDFFDYFACGLMLLVIGAYALDVSMVNPQPASIQFVEAVVVAYTVGHVVAYCSGLLIEDYFFRTYLGFTRTTLLESQEPQTHGRKFWRWVFSHSFEPLSSTAITLVRKRAEDDKLELVKIWGKAFRVASTDKSTSARMGTFLYLYGFARNSSMSLACGGLLLLIGAESSLLRSQGNWRGKGALALACLFSAIVMLFRYADFHRRYSAAVLNAYAYSPRESAQQSHATETDHAKRL